MGGGSSFPTSSAAWQSATGTTGTIATTGTTAMGTKFIDGGSRQSATGTTGITTMGTNFDDGGSRPSNDDEARPKDGAYVDEFDRYGGDECSEAGDIAEVGWVAKCPHADAWHEEVALLHLDQS